MGLGMSPMEFEWHAGFAQVGVIQTKRGPAGSLPARRLRQSMASFGLVRIGPRRSVARRTPILSHGQIALYAFYNRVPPDFKFAEFSK